MFLRHLMAEIASIATHDAWVKVPRCDFYVNVSFDDLIIIIIRTFLVPILAKLIKTITNSLKKPNLPIKKFLIEMSAIWDFENGIKIIIRISKFFTLSLKFNRLATDSHTFFYVALYIKKSLISFATLKLNLWDSEKCSNLKLLEGWGFMLTWMLLGWNFWINSILIR